MTPGDLLELQIEKAVYGGDGLARSEGRAIFVPFTLPGERVTAALTEVKGGFARATVRSLLHPSPERALPPCPYFGRCGGCQYQHGEYRAQVAIKQLVLQETLERAGLRDLPPILAHTAEPLGYRNRIRLHVDPRTSQLGYRERNSHRLLPVERCPLAAPLLERALAWLTTHGEERRLAALFAEVELSTNGDGSAVLLSIALRTGASVPDARAAFLALCASLELELEVPLGGALQTPATARMAGKRHGVRSRPDQAGAVDAADGVLPPFRVLATYGTTRMHYKAAGGEYQVSVGAFFQVNRFLLDTLAEVATADRSGKLAWDLYAGVGLFSGVLARQFSRVVAVEGAPVSAADLRVNLPAPHGSVESSTLDFLRREVARSAKDQPDFVLLDPPRAGLGQEVTHVLAQIGAAAITYVSCDPATLARDLRALVASGYQIQQVHLFDLFPQTFHLEAVVMLARG